MRFRCCSQLEIHRAVSIKIFKSLKRILNLKRREVLGHLASYSRERLGTIDDEVNEAEHVEASASNRFSTRVCPTRYLLGQCPGSIKVVTKVCKLRKLRQLLLHQFAQSRRSQRTVEMCMQFHFGEYSQCSGCCFMHHACGARGC